MAQTLDEALNDADAALRRQRWTIGQATELLKAGYHIDKVTTQTGWDESYFEGCLDQWGYWDEGR